MEEVTRDELRSDMSTLYMLRNSFIDIKAKKPLYDNIAKIDLQIRDKKSNRKKKFGNFLIRNFYRLIGKETHGKDLTTANESIKTLENQKSKLQKQLKEKLRSNSTSYEGNFLGGLTEGGKNLDSKKIEQFIKGIESLQTLKTNQEKAAKVSELYKEFCELTKDCKLAYHPAVSDRKAVDQSKHLLMGLTGKDHKRSELFTRAFNVFKTEQTNSSTLRASDFSRTQEASVNKTTNNTPEIRITPPSPTKKRGQGTTPKR